MRRDAHRHLRLAMVRQVYGFYDECQRKYGNANPWKYCTELFDGYTCICLLPATSSSHAVSQRACQSPLLTHASAVAPVHFVLQVSAGRDCRRPRAVCARRAVTGGMGTLACGIAVGSHAHVRFGVTSVAMTRLRAGVEHGCRTGGSRGEDAAEEYSSSQGSSSSTGREKCRMLLLSVLSFESGFAGRTGRTHSGAAPVPFCEAASRREAPCSERGECASRRTSRWWNTTMVACAGAMTPT